MDQLEFNTYILARVLAEAGRPSWWAAVTPGRSWRTWSMTGAAGPCGRSGRSWMMTVFPTRPASGRSRISSLYWKHWGRGAAAATTHDAP